ncbi:MULTISPECIES: 2-C-methyl-D-erythritol 2,4-cyclodiphosphate synthase [unclassified Treponema]|uniref:2-C-methyl-D-erythritol 2,4-cyclodiphosphate synthase n=1 Tax=unclassified Treponema TaxID=2638727 RepID=UPI0020A3DF6B|nr:MULTISPECIES: 2-C-methyl-D-erythritol 2,4-cyclodiphosphate synthase [unclassified Treponema]UTC66069.1 2-C-methyl-D-erythritol 2,4-cyclodiphosphate synthase [Treponema sp. OMZ 789]UTC68799.1 2-C-methyl-D-erythritol 2,4-cyclodiphosphate synthase [Treponema sp. OMZ 790]UTC71527.1 2-C-methyl-D-erythritol 2,4-cyclodiphosphate synthase [Treponema sp. OMZ 791]
MRTGLGYDLHRLIRGKKLMIGGVHIPFKKGEKAHSDGDVLLHAITDALLGACGMGDIGEFFPPGDKKWKDANSAELLSAVWEKISAQGWKIQNIDCVIIIEEPKILPFRDEIRTSIASILKIEKEQIFIKAKTGEGIGIIGKGKAAAALASCLIFC